MAYCDYQIVKAVIYSKSINICTAWTKQKLKELNGEMFENKEKKT